MLTSFYKLYVTIFTYILFMLICIRLILQLFPCLAFPKRGVKNNSERKTQNNHSNWWPDTESISVASLPSKEQAMKNTWVSSGSISAKNVWWKKVGSSSLISKSRRRTCTFELFQSRSLLLIYLNFYYFGVSLWTVIVNYLDFGIPFVLFILSDVNIGKYPFLVSLWHLQSLYNALINI